MIPQGAEFTPVLKTPSRFAWREVTSIMELAGVAAVASLVAQALPAYAQQRPTNPVIECPSTGQDLVRPPEIVRSDDGVLSGTILLIEEHERIATSAGGAKPTCADQLMRAFRKVPAGAERQREPLAKSVEPTPKAKPESELADPIPGPTLRARVGDLVQLRFVNEVNPARFNPNFVLDKCMVFSAAEGQVYPILDSQGNPNDVYPNCLHASSTANLHFHGTHTNPNTTGDNVYLQIPPLPRDNQGNLTTFAADAMVGFDQFFKDCTDQLKPNPLKYWPASWKDLPKPYLDKQEELLKAYQMKFPGQDLWDQDQQMLAQGTWPIYYIGAVPHCYALPAYTETVWPPPPGSTSPNMGQSPGTHWYHAHKHGSTHINVINGMSGAFIIEGKYDDDLNAAYGSYMVLDKDGKETAWNTRAQPVLVLNQLSTNPNLLTPTPTHFLAGQVAGVDMAVNGRLRPKVRMQPGEVQLWRIVNSSARNAAYFMAPEGFEWRQIAQDGVQFTDDNYRNSANKPFYIASANRADLLVRAPMQETDPNKPLEVLVQQVMARGQVLPTPANPSTSDPKPGTVLISIEVKGPPVKQNGQSVQMPFITAPRQPPFLTDITDDEIKGSNFIQRKLVFNSGKPKSAHQHTINGIQFSEGNAFIKIVMGAIEEWTIQNTTNSTTGPGAGKGMIDHPLHIHINPFQIAEFFDPNANMIDPTTGQLLKVLVNGKTMPIPQYRIKGQAPPVTDPRQCELDPDEPSTWVPCPNAASPPKSVWWDVFAIPSGKAVVRSGKPNVIIPGFYKMRSRFVDYKGVYVLHCHILVHEDRGMMFSVEVVKPEAVFVRHH